MTNTKQANNMNQFQTLAFTRMSMLNDWQELADKVNPDDFTGDVLNDEYHDTLVNDAVAGMGFMEQYLNEKHLQSDTELTDDQAEEFNTYAVDMASDYYVLYEVDLNPEYVEDFATVENGLTYLNSVGVWIFAQRWCGVPDYIVPMNVSFTPVV